MNVLYKYRVFNTDALSVLINRELYFADPIHLNDPYDCQISIVNAVNAAIDQAEKITSHSVRLKLEKLSNLNNLYSRIEQDVKNAGILSLSTENLNMIMWSHYADMHRGFCIGFNLSDKFMSYHEENKTDEIVGLSECKYIGINPFLEYFIEFANSPIIPEYNKFWMDLMKLGLRTKSTAWKHENEMRIIRGKPGTVKFASQEISEIIFGLNMQKQHRKTIKELLSSGDWTHLRYRHVVKKEDTFNLEIQDI